MEILLFIVLAGAFSALLYYGPGLLIRALARREFRWIFTPANTFTPIASDEDGSGDGMKGGGHIVTALHGITGCTLVKESPDPMYWEVVEDRPDPDHEKLLFKLYGIQSMGSFFWHPRVNVDKRLRFGHKKDEGKPEDVSKDILTKNVFYTGEMTVIIEEADTADKLGVNFEIDFAFKRRFPIRSVLRLADSSAFVTSLVEKAVNNRTVELPAEAYVGGEETETAKGTRENREKLIEDLEGDKELSKKILDIVGFDITSVSLRSVSMTPEHRRLLELKTKAEREGEAKVIEATRQRDARIKLAEAKEREEMVDVNVAKSYFEDVLTPASENERLAELVALDRRSTAYENNTTVTTFAPGADKMLPLGK